MIFRSDMTAEEYVEYRRRSAGLDRMLDEATAAYADELCAQVLREAVERMKKAGE